MDSEVKMQGYPIDYPTKTVIAIITGIIIAGVFFYAGAKYEKSKLASAGLLKGSSSESVAKSPKTVRPVAVPSQAGATTQNSTNSSTAANVPASTNASVHSSANQPASVNLNAQNSTNNR